MTIEEHLTQIAELIAANRATNWALGDAAAEMVREYNRGVIGSIAEVAGCSKERIMQLIAVAVEFPPEMRWPDTDWSVYRAARQAAKRIGREAAEVLREAVENGYSAADIAALGREEKQKAKLSRRCEWCGSKIAIEAAGGLAGTRVPCPVCHAEERETMLGVLEIG